MSTLTETSVPCLTPNCDKEARWKGLCSSCYGQAKNLIDADETTWEELETMQLAQLPLKPFTATFRERKAKLIAEAK